MTAERQVGERLSEQARLDELRERLMPDPTKLRVGDRLRVYAGDVTAWIEGNYARALEREVLTQARQLAEAERENGILRDAANLALVHARAVRMDTVEDEQVRARLVETVELALGLTANPPDPPASPAEGSEAATEVEA